MALEGVYIFATNAFFKILGNDILTAIAIMVVSVVGAKILYYILEKYVTQLTKATATTLDDEILAAVKRPIYFAAIIAGIYVSLVQLHIAKFQPIIDKAGMVGAIILGIYTISTLITTLINWYAANFAEKTQSKVDDQFVPVIRKIVSVFIYAIGLVIILDQLGIKVSALIASLGVASLAVALALQETLANFFAGLYVMADKPAKPGDSVRLESGQEGIVEEIGWRSTRIRMRSDDMIILPNSKLAQSILVNYSLPVKDSTFTLDCGVAYGSDLEKVEKITVNVAKEVAKKIEGGSTDFEPLVRYNSFGESNIVFSVVLRVKDYGAKPLLIHEFMKALTVEYEKEKIEISWPVRKVFLEAEKPEKKSKHKD